MADSSTALINIKIKLICQFDADFLFDVWKFQFFLMTEKWSTSSLRLSRNHAPRDHWVAKKQELHNILLFERQFFWSDEGFCCCCFLYLFSVSIVCVMSCTNGWKHSLLVHFLKRVKVHISLNISFFYTMYGFLWVKCFWFFFVAFFALLFINNVSNCVHEAFCLWHNFQDFFFFFCLLKLSHFA